GFGLLLGFGELAVGLFIGFRDLVGDLLVGVGALGLGVLAEPVLDGLVLFAPALALRGDLAARLFLGAPLLARGLGRGLGDPAAALGADLGRLLVRVLFLLPVFGRLLVDAGGDVRRSVLIEGGSRIGRKRRRRLAGGAGGCAGSGRLVARSQNL